MKFLEVRLMDEQTAMFYKAGLKQFLSAIQDTAVALRRLIEVVDSITNELENSKQKQIEKKGEM